MLSLNQIKYKLLGYLNNHAQLNQVFYSDDFDFNVERNLSYPVCNIEYLESNMNNKLLTHSYNVVLADKVDDNVEGMEDDVYSDMMIIAEDFLTHLQYDESFTFNKTAFIKKFSDDTSDRVSGLTFKITITTTRSQNTCATPVKE